MKKFQINSLNNNKPFYFFIISISILLHLIAITYQPVNDEFIFFKGADFIFSFQKDIINIFFEYNANTLGFSLLIAVLKFVLPFLDTSQISKLLSISSLFFFAAASQKIYLIFKPKIKFKFFLILVLLNPLIWNYTFRGIPDAFSASICLFSIFYILYNDKLNKNLIYISIFSFGVIIKPFNAILILLIFYFHFFEKKQKHFLKILILFLLLIFFYFSINFLIFNFLITPHNFSNVFEPNINKYFITLINYLGFLFFLGYPFFIKTISNFFPKKKYYNLFFYIILFLISYILSIYFDISLSEMNFGYISGYISTNFFETFIIFNCFLIFFIFIITLKKKEKKSILLLTLILIFTLIMSFTHSAQRYLMVLVPLAYVYFNSQKTKKYLISILILLYMVVNLLIFGNLYNNNKVISEIVLYLNNNKILSKTNPGYIGQHALNNFTKFHHNKLKIKKSDIFNDKLYTIVDKKPLQDNIVLYEAVSKFIFIERKLFLIKNL